MKKYRLPLLLSLLFVTVGMATLSDYGINWDAPLHMLEGQAYAHLYLTGQDTYGIPKRLSPLIVGPQEYASRYLLVAAERIPPGTKKPVALPERPLFRAEFDSLQRSLGQKISFYQAEQWNGAYSLANDEGGHLPMIDILSAFSNRLFYQRLGILGDIESYQLVYVLIAALGVFLVTLFAWEITGSWEASLVSGLSLGLFPIYFAESHINMKDPQQAVFFLGAVWAFYHWVKDNKLKWFLIFTLFVAFSLAIKWNIIFLPFILVPWLFTIRKTEEFKRWFLLKRLIVFAVIAFCVWLALMVAVWPYAWQDPIRALLSLPGFYADIGVRPDSFEIERFVPVLLFFQSPPIILALMALVFLSKRRYALREASLCTIWLLVTLARVSTPATWYYGEVRQIMEAVPAMALLSGLGVISLTKKIGRLFVVVVLITLSIPIIRLHPNQNAYFNFFIGGPRGATDKGFVDWGITYGNIYKQGVEWLNQNAPENANLVHLAGPDFAISPLWLRADISISPYLFSGFDQKGEYFMVLNDPQNPSVFASEYPKNFLDPIYAIEVDRVPMLFIYKNDQQFTRISTAGEKTRQVMLDRGIADLGYEINITRIVLGDVNPQCLDGQGSKEEIVFISELNDKKVYTNNEIKAGEKGNIEYNFAAVPVRAIRLEIRDRSSCLNGRQVLQVSYLD